MRKIFLLLVTLMMSLSILQAHSANYELAICAIFRDDAKYLPEWIEFHKKQGVEHFFLYDNLSNDNPRDILKAYIRDKIVTLIDWPYESQGQDFFAIQCASYMDCVNKNKNYRWIAFLDTDEFLFCPEKTDLRTFLEDFLEYGSVSAYWMMYGTSNINIPEGGRITDYLLYRAKDDYGAHKTMKTIAQPKYVQDIINPHYVIHKDGNKNHQIQVNKLRINHYWSRDLDFFYNIKLPRRQKWYPELEMQIQWEREMNEVYDPILSNSCS